MRRRTALAFIFAVVIVVGGATFAGMMTWVLITEDYKGYSAPETFVEIPQGAGASDIGRRLVDAGVVQNAFVFRGALVWTGEARLLKAGEYRFDRALSAVEVVNTLARGDVYVRPITFPEGLTIAEMAKIFETHGFGTTRAFIDAARDVSSISDLDPAARDLEGYLFPETYKLPHRADAATLVGMMVGRFRAIYNDDLRRRAEVQGLTTRAVVTLASVVEKETGKADERPTVAAVYRNRLKIGMPMQADPTLVYALQKTGRYDGNIRRDDLGLDSPYNTYRHGGLPPGPIASPGKAALEAALAPADTAYLYFVSRNDGSHVFAQTLTEHNRNVLKYQVEYFRAGGRGQGAGGSKGQAAGGRGEGRRQRR